MFSELRVLIFNLSKHCISLLINLLTLSHHLCSFILSHKSSCLLNSQLNIIINIIRIFSIGRSLSELLLSFLDFFNLLLLFLTFLLNKLLSSLIKNISNIHLSCLRNIYTVILHNRKVSSYQYE
ncbi:MAG: hypothetical protein EBS99_15765, partial [Betaproteobacteria bacterium]|nr:hypothetical protein [Betaproteobacteria bacterium]